MGKAAPNFTKIIITADLIPTQVRLDKIWYNISNYILDL